MKTARLLVPSLLVVAGLLAAANSVFTVGQAQQAVVLRFGQPVQVINAGPRPDEAGLHVKWPFAEQVATFDRRPLTLDSTPVDLLTPGQAALKVTAALRYRIVDPLQFHRVEGDAGGAVGRLQTLLDASVQQALVGATLRDIVSDRQDALMRSALLSARREAAVDRLGVQITDLNLLNAAPSSIAAAEITRQMQDRETQQAAQIRVEGEQRRRELLAEADRAVIDIHGDADRQALDVRGDGDAQRAAILGDAYGKDPDFARFFRRLEAYDQALNPDNTTLVLSPDTAFLSLFGHGPGAAAPSR